MDDADWENLTLAFIKKLRDASTSDEDFKQGLEVARETIQASLEEEDQSDEDGSLSDEEETEELDEEEDSELQPLDFG